MGKKIILTFLVFLLILPFSFAQAKKSPTSAPKLGLVLSGGGAKGFAHIGLLKVMEEVGIRPDFITGASMGSIVGGLYALGLSAKELEEMAVSQDWGLLLSNQVDLRQINIIEKETYGSHFLSLEYDNGSLHFPQGLIEGQQLSLALARFACAGHLIDDFDDFPIPFKCVAVNLLDGEIVVLDTGYLAKAQRASMAIPSVFTPVEYGEKLLVDGGVIRNLPVQEVIDMGADVVIGSYAGGEDPTKEELHTAIDILIQSSFLYSIADSREQAESCDILFDLSRGFGPADFDKAAEIIAQGEQLARQHIDTLKALANRMNRFPRKPPKERLYYPDSLQIDHLNTSSVDPTLEPLVRRLLNLKEGKKHDVRKVEAGINYAFGTQFFKKVNYGLSTDTLGRTTMNIEADEVEPVILKFGLHYSNADDAAIILKGDLRHLGQGATSLFGQVRISKSPAFNAHFKQYIGPNRRFLYKIEGAFQKNNQHFSLQDGALIRSYNRRKLGAIGQLMYIPRNDYLFGVGYQWNSWELEPNEIAALDFSQLSSSSQSVQFFFKQNSLDKSSFPQKGQVVNLAATYHYKVDYETDFTDENAGDFLNIAQPNDYFKAQLFFSNYIPLTSSFTAFQHIGLGITSEPILFDNFLLGGDYFTGQQAIPFVGLQEYEAPFSNVASAQIGFRLALTPKLMFALKGNIAHGTDQTSAFFQEAGYTYYGAGISLGYDTFMGPAVFTFGRNSYSNDFQLAVSLGHRFGY